LQHPENRKQLSFDLHNGGYDVQAGGDNGAYRHAMEYAGWVHRRIRADAVKRQQKTNESAIPLEPTGTQNPFDNLPPSEGMIFDPAMEQHAGIIVGIGIALYDRTNTTDPETGKKIVRDELMLLPGDDVMLTFPTAEMPLRFQSDSFTAVDLYESKMAEYDRKLVFVPIEKLQYLRGMVDADSGTYTTTHILIKAKPGVDINVVRDRLRDVFPRELYNIYTWQDDQQMLLNAVITELAMLNVLLFLIFAVAGFGILAIFYMIVVEKQRDIGILKALGASSGGVMQIFLYYSLLLGIVGSALGLAGGLLFVKYIKEIAAVLSYILNRDVFSPEVYSFYEIPTIVDVPTVIYIIAGALFIAASAGVLPALRAARVHPVETLRS
jgi:lipoprotein-releasing system permease protein